MNEQMRIKIIGVCLVIVIIWGGLNYNKKPEDIQPPQTIQPLDSNSQVVSNNKSHLIEVEKYSKMAWGRSPFYAKSLESITKTDNGIVQENSLSWVLSGIIFNNTSPTAIINKRPVKIGEKINNALVTNINKENVTIEYNKEEITLTVSKG